MLSTQNYSFSFTAAGLRIHDFSLVIKHRADESQELLINLLGKGKASTGKRILQELSLRYHKLTPDQKHLYENTDLISQKQLAFLAVCKTYRFIHDFMVEVLREKMLVYDYQVRDTDFITFIRNKEISHTEIEKLSDHTKEKVRTVTFRILAEAGLIDSPENMILQPQIIQEDVFSVIVEDHTDWLMVFLLQDSDIQNLLSTWSK